MTGNSRLIIDYRTQPTTALVRVFRATKAGALYAITVFLIGFILGSMRILLVAPRLGKTIAVIVQVTRRRSSLGRRLEPAIRCWRRLFYLYLNDVAHIAPAVFVAGHDNTQAFVAQFFTVAFVGDHRRLAAKIRRDQVFTLTRRM
jgi:hypothetical protein